MTTKQTADSARPSDCFKKNGNIDFLNGPVYAKEKERIALRRKHAKARPSKEEDTVALCLSGGGIRSAVFNLGLLQGLKKNGKLKLADYLSTVSGGGYIGSCLTWFRALGFGFPFGTARKDHRKTLGGGVLDWLRAHGNYLTPGDNLNAWAMASAVIAGTLVSLLIVLPILLTLVYFFSHFEVSIPRADALLKEAFSQNDGFRVVFAVGLASVALFLVLSVIFALLTGIRAFRSDLLDNRVRSVLGFMLSFGIFLLIAGSLPFCHEFLSGERFKEWTAHIMSGVSLSGAIGVASALWHKKQGSETKGIRAILLSSGTALACYGIFLWAYHVIAPAEEFPHWLIVGLFSSLALALFSNINHVSMHRFYRNRLMDAYMPHILLQDDKESAAKLKKAAARNGRPCADQFRLADIEQNSDAPYHIINTNIQTVDSKQAKLKERGGESFILSPEYCGSEHTRWVETSRYLGGTLNLATAMAISGAAVDPNTYVTRSRPLSFLMSLFNLRLGYWTLNPSQTGLTSMPYVRRVFFNLSWYISLFADLLGFGLKETRRVIHLSDGGHFENLGLYEMVRRECSHIVVSDSGADPDRTFGDLARALSMIRIDFGAKVEGFDTAELIPNPKDGRSKLPFAVCSIEYKSGKKGTLYYIKPSIIDDLPPDVFSYFANHPSFPHESTADQFFNERQFEAYRELGYRIGDLFCKKSFHVETVALDEEEEGVTSCV